MRVEARGPRRKRREYTARESTMKQISATGIAIAVLSIGLLAFLHHFAPDPPLSADEIEFLIGVCAVAVVSVRWVTRRLRWHEVRP
jgi:hypothetical protein